MAKRIGRATAKTRKQTKGNVASQYSYRQQMREREQHTPRLVPRQEQQQLRQHGIPRHHTGHAHNVASRTYPSSLCFYNRTAPILPLSCAKKTQELQP